MSVSLIIAVVAWAAAPGVSPVLGDASMVAGYVPSLDGLAPDAVEQARVRGHLRWVHDLLAAADTSQLPLGLRLARAPSADGDDHVRWSAGVTGRLVKRKRRWSSRGPFERVQPAVTVATVRTIESWATTLSLELAFAARATDGWFD